MLFESLEPTQRFYQVFVKPNRSYLARMDSLKAGHELVEPRLFTYMGVVFEEFLLQTRERIFVPNGFPSVREELRSEGLD